MNQQHVSKSLKLFLSNMGLSTKKDVDIRHQRKIHVRCVHTWSILCLKEIASQCNYCFD